MADGPYYPRFFDGKIIRGSDLGNAFMNVLDDGFLYGGGLTLTNNTNALQINIASGGIIGCGRLCTFTNVTLSYSGVGYIRVKCVIQPSQTDPVSFETTTAVASIGALSSLTQNAINNNGSKYEMEICVIDNTGATPYIYRQIGMARAKVNVYQATVSSSDWSTIAVGGNPQVNVTVADVHWHNNPLVTYSPTSFQYWREYGVFCAGYGEGYVTLAALKQPAVDIGVEIRL